MKSWLKWGFWFIGIFIFLVILAFITDLVTGECGDDSLGGAIEDCRPNIFNSIILIPAYPVMLFLHELKFGGASTIPLYFGMGFSYSIIGALIGLIIGKVKHKKQQSLTS